MMLSIKYWQNLSADEKKQCLSRPLYTSSIRVFVENILKQVRECGDEAVLKYTEQFDGVRLDTLRIPKERIEGAKTNQKSLDAMNKAIETLTTYHRSLLPENQSVCTAEGVRIDTYYRPIQRVGLYVPGGNNTPLVSSLLMQAIPARVAGCPITVLCTPPDSEGKINEHLLVAARLCGIENIYSVGGAQAISAMAYGTETITKVDKIFGPGNSYVTEAKTQVALDPGGATIDMSAGPSELMILADNLANPAFIAADLLAQSEHGVDSQVILICDSLELANQVNQQVKIQLTSLNRESIIKKSLINSLMIICEDKAEQMNLINDYAPEHLIINREDGALWVDKINAAGTVFLGSWAGETLGDYITGSNHVLPTNGFARSQSGLSTVDFITRFNVQSISQTGIKNLGPAAITLAQIEGLTAHAQAVAIRLKSLEI